MREVWQTVDRRFYARDKNGVDWPAMREKHLPAAREAADKAQVYEVINEMLGELGASHTVLIDGEVYRDHFAPEMTGMMGILSRFQEGGGVGRAGKPKVLGLEIVGTGGKFFVRTIFDDGPAAKAGVKIGDELLEIDGAKAADSGRLLFAGGDTHVKSEEKGYYIRLAPDAAQVEITLRRAEGGEPERRTLTPVAMNGIDATRNSVKVVNYGDRARIGYVHTWHFLATEITAIVRAAIQREFADCDALIIDLRGRGGQPAVISGILGLIHGPRRIWTRPVVCLQDEHSRSAKEIFAHEFKRKKAGILVGRRTEGAVLGSQFFRMPDGSYLLLAMVDGKQFSSDGVTLEGHGVEPHVVVESSFPYCAGADPIYLKGLAVAAAYAQWLKNRAPADGEGSGAALPMSGGAGIIMTR